MFFKKDESMKETVLITGTSSGVGLETAIHFARKGYKVYASMRNLSKAEELNRRIKTENLDISVIQLDVQDPYSIHSAVETIVSKEGRIDVLVNNAGVGFLRTLEVTDDADIKRVTEINYLGVVRCTKAVLPYMSRQKKGHIITVSSAAGLVGFPFNELYSGSKFAVEGFMESLASYLPQTINVNVSLLEPGGISTNFMRRSLSASTYANEDMCPADYRDLFNTYLKGKIKRVEGKVPNTYQTTAQIAEAICHLAQMKDPPLRIRTSDYAERMCHIKTQGDPDGMKIRQIMADYFFKDE